MVFVKVRETYDLQTIQNKMSVIAVHTPHPDIIKRNFPGLLMQCKAYRPVSCDVRLACASVLPLDPQGVGLTEGSVAPEDVFNPILYKACSNFGMSQIEARIWALSHGEASLGSQDVNGDTANVEVDNLTNYNDEFPVYYGLLSNAHGWKHANPQAGLEMTGLKPFVYEMLYNVGDNYRAGGDDGTTSNPPYPNSAGYQTMSLSSRSIRGNAKPVPFINCTSYSAEAVAPGFDVTNIPWNHEVDVPWINCVVGAVIVPPSKLHQLFYRMVCEWTIEFSQIRPIGEITNWQGLAGLGTETHYQNYSYPATKEALTGSPDSIMDKDTNMVSTTAPISKVF